MNLFSFIKKSSGDFAVLDVGTSVVRFQSGDTNVSIPSFCTKNKEDEWEYVGEMAREIEGKIPAGMSTVRPLRNSVVVDYDALVKVLQEVKVQGRGVTSIGTTVPFSASEVEINALVEAIKYVFKCNVFVFDSLTANYFDPNVREKKGVFIVDSGAGSTKLGVIHKGTIIKQRNISAGGDQIDEAIKSYLKNKYGLVLGNLQAESLKKDLHKKIAKTVRGQSVRGGLPKELKVQSHEIEEAIEPVMEEIADNVTNLFEMMTPQTVEEVMQQGIILTGGCSHIPLLKKYITKSTKLVCISIDVPEESGVRGLAYVMNDFSLRQTFRIQDLILK